MTQRVLVFNVTSCPRGGKARAIKCAICSDSIMTQIVQKTTGRRALTGTCRRVRKVPGIRPARR